MPLITPFDPWKNKYCTCPDKLSLSPYTGCAHNCLYCYAASYIRDFSNPRPKKDFIKRLENEIKKIPEGSIIAVANSSDPYQPMEDKLQLTRRNAFAFKKL
jgi:DNA repair photolyase